VWLQYVAGSSGVSESSNNLRFQILAFKRKLLNCGVSVSDGAIYGEQSEIGFATISSEFFGECRQILLAGRSGQAGVCFLVGSEGKIHGWR